MPDALDTIFKAYDVRGLYPEQIDEATAHRIGNAFAVFTGAPTIVVGHDMRPSSVPLSRAFIEGAVLAGADVVVAAIPFPIASPADAEATRQVAMEVKRPVIAAQ